MPRPLLSQEVWSGNETKGGCKGSWVTFGASNPRKLRTAMLGTYIFTSQIAKLSHLLASHVCTEQLYLNV